ncbi:hypothetical protein C2S53_008206 [Perilla frutescens var. hirtella]|uniref:Jacalin-type lectin domain-containing protein n=1 Tax=Perilla frutescens var. hirtella TaxID=608512 RepID=A0AAD4J1K8_PERFH|nr:hypothetical protein C2S53_008206 [Perilla frutescens var. hirtella]
MAELSTPSNSKARAIQITPPSSVVKAIKLDFPSEFLTGVSGSYGHNCYGNNIQSLKFKTNRAEYGPFGSGSGTRFSFQAKDGMITGFHGRAGRYLDAIGVCIVPVCSISTKAGKKRYSGNDSSCHSPPRSAAAWGGGGGRDWDDGVFSAVKGVNVRLRSDTDVVSAVRFVYEKKDGEIFFSPFHGGHCGEKIHRKTVEIDFPSEFLTGVSGTYSENAITSLKFQTNRIEYGPFGVESGTTFSFNTKDGLITGFHGRAGQFLNAIGVYTMPACSISTEAETKQHSGIGSSTDQLLLRPRLPPPRSAGPCGGSGGRDWDDGVFSAVVAVDVRLNTNTGVIAAVRFSCKRKDGSCFLSPLHGGHCSVRKTIEFEEDSEFLIGVEGFYGVLKGINIIRSLTFITNKAKHGPMGSEFGTYFSSMDFSDCNRKVVGFHGRSGDYLDAIGVHTEYF